MSGARPAHRRYYRHGLCPVWPNGKKCYPTINEALWARRVLEVKRPGIIYAVFKCTHCRHWHVGKRGEESA